jgi:hypothetical protein
LRSTASAGLRLFILKRPQLGLRALQLLCRRVQRRHRLRGVELALGIFELLG